MEILQHCRAVTNCKGWSPSTQVIALISRNPKIHDRVRKSVPLVPFPESNNFRYLLKSNLYTSILVLFSHLCLGLSRGPFPSGFSISNYVHAPLITACIIIWRRAATNYGISKICMMTVSWRSGQCTLPRGKWLSNQKPTRRFIMTDAMMQDIR